MIRFITAMLLTLWTTSLSAADLIPELASLKPFVGTTWRSVSGGFGGAEDFHDVAKWEIAMDGRVVRITHSIDDGAYGGESLVHYDGETGKIIYRYVTTAGFYTDGEIIPLENGFEAHEYIRGLKDGPTETMAGYSVKDGQMHTWAKVMTGGVWSDISNTVYEAAPDAVVKFK